MSVKQHEAFAFDSFQDMLLFFDDFHGDQVQDEWDTTFTGAGTIVVVDQQTGGIIRLTTGALNLNDSLLDWNDIRTLLASKRVSFESRLKLGDATINDIRIGLRFGAVDHISFSHFTNAGALAWKMNCNNGGALTSANTDLTADTSYHIFRFESHTHGSPHVHFYIDGTEETNSPLVTNVPPDYLQPFFFIRTREALAKTMDVDYCYIREER